ncbi:MAG: hypothetical protein CMA72_06895 [Euryarchaeota archaeon]|nr:hypothetical protein [Euryarchaeota archaeon]
MKILQNLKQILVYSDSELTELMLVLVLLFVDPMRSHVFCCSPATWSAVGVISGIVLFFGLVFSKLRVRQVGLLIAVAFFIAASMIEFNHGHWNYSDHGTYLVQALVAMFLWVRDDKERLVMSAKRRAKNGTE